ncbi:hypothetical protein ACFGVR_10885 [Mucilaginibacter sp. AW1-3]
MKTALELLPPQQTGGQTDFTCEQQYDTLGAAHQAFHIAAGRMLSVNNWHDYAGAGSAKFTLCNNQGDELEVMAEEGFFISIDLPGPGPDAGSGVEWVLVERLASEGGAHTAEEYVLMTVRPCADPRRVTSEIAHFYDEISTSTFIVRRDGRTVSAGVHGRNEIPNNGSVDLHDKIRNTAIALAARIGLSGGQWQQLVNGLIEYQESKAGETGS